MLQALDLFFQRLCAFGFSWTAIVDSAILKSVAFPASPGKHLTEIIDPKRSYYVRIYPVVPKYLTQGLPLLPLIVGQLLECFCENNVILSHIFHKNIRA